jgi:23S rRNA pseudouridine2605 synthase
MARRHVDRKPGERFERGPGPSKPSGRPSGRPAPAGRPSSSGRPSGDRPSGGGSGGGRTGAGRSGPGRSGSGRSGSGRSGAGRSGEGPRRPFGSKRRADGLVVTPTKKPELSKDGKVRLNHFLAMAGVCSRRAADELIAAGRITVNGEMVRELGVRIDPKVDDVRFDETRVQPERATYVLFNKPTGVVCTNAAHEQKKRVIDFLPQVKGRLFTVGRLDMDSEGLILLTNDGAFAQEMTHPRYGMPKVYSVMVRGRVEDAKLSKARSGVWLAEGPTAGMGVKIEKLGKDRTYLKVTLREGKNREIRRVFAKLGYPVITLKRIRIGDLTLHGLKEGTYRFLQLDEVARLREIAREELSDS